MPVLIEQVTIVVEVSNQAAGGGATPPPAEQDKQQLIETCVEQVLRVLELQKEQMRREEQRQDKADISAGKSHYPVRCSVVPAHQAVLQTGWHQLVFYLLCGGSLLPSHLNQLIYSAQSKMAGMAILPTRQPLYRKLDT